MGSREVLWRAEGRRGDDNCVMSDEARGNQTAAAGRSSLLSVVLSGCSASTDPALRAGAPPSGGKAPLADVQPVQPARPSQAREWDWEGNQASNQRPCGLPAPSSFQPSASSALSCIVAAAVAAASACHGSSAQGRGRCLVAACLLPGTHRACSCVAPIQSPPAGERALLCAASSILILHRRVRRRRWACPVARSRAWPICPDGKPPPYTPVLPITRSHSATLFRRQPVMALL